MMPRWCASTSGSSSRTCHWRIIDDSTLTAGGCRVELGASEVDATLETRWRRVIEAIGVSQEWLRSLPATRMTDRPDNQHLLAWGDFLEGCRQTASQVNPLLASGHLTRINGLVMEASGLKLALGSSCRITPLGGSPIEAEVVGFHGERLFLMPSEDVYGLSPGARVVALDTPNQPPQVGLPPPARRRSIDRAKLVPVGDSLLGRVLDGAGRPLDRLGPLHAKSLRPLQSRPVNPMSRAAIEQTLDVGMRAINALLTVGRGQRMGLFRRLGRRQERPARHDGPLHGG
jgi:hypothetical protein